jgi:hypothetical protein
MKTAPLLHWVREREKIRLKRAGGTNQPPWTRDPVLQKYRFCNVRRKHDRVSKWLIGHVLQFVYATTPHSVVFTALCRWINWPPTLTALMEQPWFNTSDLDMPRVGRFLDERMATRTKTWTGAYIVPGAIPPGYKKGSYIASISLGGMHNDEFMTELLTLLIEGKRQKIHKHLMTLPLWGSFMAGQVIDDWTWTPILSHAKDIYTWAPRGPGSQRGLNRLLGHDLHHRLKEDEWCTGLARVLEAIHKLGPEYQDVTSMDAQNCLCEYDKYARISNGEKQTGLTTYRPETAF